VSGKPEPGGAHGVLKVPSAATIARSAHLYDRSAPSAVTACGQLVVTAGGQVLLAADSGDFDAKMDR